MLGHCTRTNPPPKKNCGALKMTVIPTVIGALGIVLKGLLKRLDE